MNKVIIAALVTFVVLISPLIARSDEDHDHKEESHGHTEGEAHEEAPSSVGAEKGVLEASADKGIRLGEKAEKKFGIKTLAFVSGSITLPKSAVFFGLQEKNLYRLRDGFYKRIDFSTLSKSNSQFTITSPDLKSGDQIVTEGLGFLRIAEIAAFGGVAHGHSH